MAKQGGRFKITGTIDGICFYRMHGNYYVRMKSSLTRKRVMRDPAFQRTREHAVLLGEASKIASAVYRQISGEQKKHALYRELTGKAMQLLREGKDKEAVFQILWGLYVMKEKEQKTVSGPKETCKTDVKDNQKVLVSRYVYNPFLSLKVSFPKPERRRKYFRSGFRREMRNDRGP